MNNDLKKLKEADAGYYNNDKPIMTDKEYDALKDKFTKENPTHDYLKNVGNIVKGKRWKKTLHGKYPMGRLDRVNTIENLQAFMDKQEEIKQAINTLEKAGYSVNSLWHISDVKDEFNYNMTDYKAKVILDLSLDSEYIHEEITAKIRSLLNASE